MLQKTLEVHSLCIIYIPYKSNTKIVIVGVKMDESTRSIYLSCFINGVSSISSKRRLICLASHLLSNALSYETFISWILNQMFIKMRALSRIRLPWSKISLRFQTFWIVRKLFESPREWLITSFAFALKYGIIFESHNKLCIQPHP